MRRDWKFIAAVAALTVIAIVRVGSTHRTFSATMDEPIHLAAGFEWLGGTYTVDPSHPPLARILCALPLRLAGVAAPTNAADGNAILYRGAYEQNLSRARSGNLLLLAIAIAATAAWARRAFSRGVALCAVALFATLPPVLAHAGLVTTDLAVAAMFPLAMLTLERFLDTPSALRGLAVGTVIALGILAKFSFVVFFPAAALVVIVVRWPMRTRWSSLAVACVTTFFVVWAGYLFEVGKPRDLSRDAVFLFHYSAPEPLVGAARALAGQTLPAPSLALGMAMVRFHDRQGHEAVFLGNRSDKGWWYYFPVVLFYKTPLPFLALALWGGFVTRPRTCAAVALAVLLVAMTSSINIGIRHLLPIYAPLSILAANAVVAIWTRATSTFSSTALAAVLAWLFIGTAAAHPDYLPYFNELAQPNPASIAADSNLDWGQDALRLAQVAREMGIDTLHVAILGTIHFPSHGVHAVILEPHVKTSGWIAVSETPLALRAEEHAWLKTYRPVRRIGSSIRLYFIP